MRRATFLIRLFGPIAFMLVVCAGIDHLKPTHGQTVPPAPVVVPPHLPVARPDACQAVVTRVIDGDTFVAIAQAKFFDTQIQRQVTVRLASINCPEVHGATKEAGEKAAAYTRARLQGRVITVRPLHPDDFGRWVAYAVVDGVEINQELVDQGLAVPYLVEPR